MPVSITSASSGPAAAAGAEIAAAGGNAVDAAVAATIVGMVTEPGIVAAGAGSFIVVWPPGGSPVVIDAYAAMPGVSGGAPTHFGEPVWMEYGGGMETLVGAGSVAIPGSWAGLGKLLDQHGDLTWARVLAPAIGLADAGFPMSEVSALYLGYAYDPIYSRDPQGRAYLGAPDGGFHPAGTMLHPAGLGDALRVIADEGPGSWYRGTIAEKLIAVMEEGGGWITAADLEAYEATTRDPVQVEVGEWTVATNPPPALGGSVLAAMLMLLTAEGYRGLDEDVDTMIEVQRSVLEFRREHLDDHEDELTPRDLLERAALGDHRALLQSPSTIHVSSVDETGLACAITSSAGYGSGVMIPGTGLALNNSLGEVDLHPNGLDGLAPGDRLPSNMAPSVARRADGAVVAVGSPGASRITTALAQVLAGVALEDRTLEDAIARPRLHVEVFDGKPTIAHEEGIDIGDRPGVVNRTFPPNSMYFGGVGAAAWSPDRGTYGVADPRRTGVVAGGG